MIRKKIIGLFSTVILTSMFFISFANSEKVMAYNAGGDGMVKFNSWNLNNLNSTSDLWTQTRSNYIPERIKDRVVYGDFDGNGKDEVAAFYDYGNADTKIHRLYEKGGKYYNATAWQSGSGNFNAQNITSKVVAGDFNGDGKDEVAALYAYSGSTVRIFNFSLKNDGQEFSAKPVWESKSFNGRKVTAMVAGDFDKDKKDEVLIFYDYGNRHTGMFQLKLDSDGNFKHKYAWESKTYDSNMIKNKTVAGDFDGDGKDEVAMFYDYQNGTTKIWLLRNNNGVYGAGEAWYAPSFNTSKISSKVVATHNKNNSKDKIVALYDYGSLKTGIFTWELKSNNKFSAKKERELTNYEAARIEGRVVVGKFDGQTMRLAAMYDGTIVQSQTKGEKVVAEAKKYLGIPYVSGGKGPSGFDCSGFTSYVYRHALGIEIGGSTYQQIYSGREVSRSELQPGDLVFPHSGHVGIYIGNGQMIHSPHTGDVVKIAPVYAFWRARRIIN